MQDKTTYMLKFIPGEGYIIEDNHSKQTDPFYSIEEGLEELDRLMQGLNWETTDKDPYNLFSMAYEISALDIPKVGDEDASDEEADLVIQSFQENFSVCFSQWFMWLEVFATKEANLWVSKRGTFACLILVDGPSDDLFSKELIRDEIQAHYNAGTISDERVKILLNKVIVCVNLRNDEEDDFPERIDGKPLEGLPTFALN